MYTITRCKITILYLYKKTPKVCCKTYFWYFGVTFTFSATYVYANVCLLVSKCFDFYGLYFGNILLILCLSLNGGNGMVMGLVGVSYKL